MSTDRLALGEYLRASRHLHSPLASGAIDRSTLPTEVDHQFGAAVLAAKFDFDAENLGRQDRLGIQFSHAAHSQPRNSR